MILECVFRLKKSDTWWRHRFSVELQLHTYSKALLSLPLTPNFLSLKSDTYTHFLSPRVFFSFATVSAQIWFQSSGLKWWSEYKFQKCI
ncbi:unnamed protein product, partial [Vitis vinifera]